MKSWKECPSFDKSLGKRKGYLADCQHAVNCRACRRCPQVPKSKLRLWAEENKPAMLMTPFTYGKKSLITTKSNNETSEKNE